MYIAALPVVDGALHLNQKRRIAGQMPQVRQAAFLIALLTLEIGQPVPVECVPVTLRLHLPPVLRIMVLFVSVHADRCHSIDQADGSERRARLSCVSFDLLVLVCIFWVLKSTNWTFRIRKFIGVFFFMCANWTNP